MAPLYLPIFELFVWLSVVFRGWGRASTLEVRFVHFSVPRQRGHWRLLHVSDEQDFLLVVFVCSFQRVMIAVA